MQKSEGLPIWRPFFFSILARNTSGSSATARWRKTQAMQFSLSNCADIWHSVWQGTPYIAFCEGFMCFGLLVEGSACLNG
jgi:hypothetical protein